MKTLRQVLAEVNRADVACGKIVDSVFSELSFGETALHIAATWGDVEAIEALVLGGADIDKQGEDGFTPLHYAAGHDRPEAVAALLRLGARNVRSDDGETPHELALLLGHAAIGGILAQHGF